jgi:predicted nucleic acid-binding protein
VTNGAKFLLDTNYILGLLKSSPDVLTDVSARGIHLSQSCYSAITRMELLGFPGIEKEETSLIEERLRRLTYIPLTEAIENRTIELRQSRKVKLPDAIIAATALVHDLQLLTLDKKLLNVMSEEGLSDA